MARIALLAWVAGFLYVSAAATAADGLSDAKLRSAAKKLRAYLHEDDAKARAKAWSKVERDLKKATPAQFEAALRVSYFGGEYQPGFRKGIEFESQGEKWTYSVHMPSKAPREPLPLVVDIGHSTVTEVEGVMNTWMEITGTREDVIYLRTDVLNRLFSDGRGEKWSAFRRASGEPNMDTVANVLLDCVGDATRRLPVDSDRVYVHGISQTGFWAWYLGMFAPGRFAAVVPVASRTLHVRHYPENFSTVSVHILHGTADSVCPFADAELMYDKLKALKADVEFTRVENGPHTGITFGRWRDVWKAVEKKKRSERYPKEFEATLLGPGRTVVHWIEMTGMKDSGFQIGQKPGRVKAKIDGQRIALEVEGPKEIVVWLSSEMVDLDETVTIALNGQPAFSGKPKLAFRAAAEFAIRRGDGGTVYSAAIPLRVR